MNNDRLPELPEECQSPTNDRLCLYADYSYTSGRSQDDIALDEKIERMYDNRERMYDKDDKFWAFWDDATTLGFFIVLGLVLVGMVLKFVIWPIFGWGPGQ